MPGDVTGAAVAAVNAAPLDRLGEQRFRYELAKRVAAEHGDVVVNVLPIVNGRAHRRRGEDPVVALRERDPYSRGYRWEPSC